MWSSSLLPALALFALPAVVRAVTIDNPKQCFTLSRDGSQYLDSTSSVLKIQSHTNRADLEAGDDKGVRFHFPLGEGGWVICEAHNDHACGGGVPPTEWRTDQSFSSTSELLTITLTQGGTKAVLNATPRHFVGANAEVASSPFEWDIQPINCLVEK